MKVIEKFPNFKDGLLFLIEDKSPSLVSNDSRLYSYMIPLKNFSKGFDYYELTPNQNGGVYLSVVTMIGLKTIVRTNSDVYFEDLKSNEWFDVVFKTATNHFSKEEYIQLKKGYVKKSPNGCMAGLGLLVASSSLGYILF